MDFGSVDLSRCFVLPTTTTHSQESDISLLLYSRNSTERFQKKYIDLLNILLPVLLIVLSESCTTASNALRNTLASIAVQMTERQA